MMKLTLVSFNVIGFLLLHGWRSTEGTVELITKYFLVHPLLLESLVRFGEDVYS